MLISCVRKSGTLSFMPKKTGSAEVGDACVFWRRDPGGPSEVVNCEVLEVIEETDQAFIHRFDTNTFRWITWSRLRVTKLREQRADWDEEAVQQEYARQMEGHNPAK